ncbi:MAG: DUF3375 domain-containing protein [Legionella sp.]|uniref:DUF3375 domain-containing protein n=1 Tax=Legionella sp. TaxID=459 RepID=UPI0039E42889
MALDFHYLTQLKKNHPAWRLLQADHAPLIASFLDQAFIQTNERVLCQSSLVAKLEDTLFQLQNEEGDSLFPCSAQHYLDEWSQNSKGWLRKFYSQGSDKPHYDLTPATEKALVWLDGLAEKRFVGTESRLLIVFELLRQMVHGVEKDVTVRIAELEKRKQGIDKEIAALQSGELALMDDSALKDRFFQVNSIARELLSDFRTVEHNFRELDRAVREQIASWDGRKGQLLQHIFGERDAITDSDQGCSFKAFWDFLMSPASQEELSFLLDEVFKQETLKEFIQDKRLQRIHFDWLEAGEYTQRTVAKLSQQLRRFLDDQTYLENKRIMQILDNINIHALNINSQIPTGHFMTLDEPAPSINLPMIRPLFTPPAKIKIQMNLLTDAIEEVVPEALFNQFIIDKNQLTSNI